jgi:hypothetical protein
MGAMENSELNSIYPETGITEHTRVMFSILEDILPLNNKPTQLVETPKGNPTMTKNIEPAIVSVAKLNEAFNDAHRWRDNAYEKVMVFTKALAQAQAESLAADEAFASTLDAYEYAMELRGPTEAEVAADERYLKREKDMYHLIGEIEALRDDLKRMEDPRATFLNLAITELNDIEI